MATDLIIGAIKDRQWADIEVYVKSLDANCYLADKVMLVENADDYTVDRLREYDIEVIRRGFSTKVHFQTTRYFSALEFLRSEWESYRSVVWTDVTDVVFQKDPHFWLAENRTADVVAAKEGWLIKNQGINDVWIQKLLSRDEYLKMRENEVLCSGTIAGTIDGMLELFDRMCFRINQGVDGMQGIDQGIFNIEVRQMNVQIPEPNEAWVATMGIFLAPSNTADWTIDPPVLEEGDVWTPNGQERYCIQHQYNRHHGALDPSGTWRGTVEGYWR